MKKRAPQLKLPGKLDLQFRWLIAYLVVVMLVTCTHADPVHKISIVPPGRAAPDYTMQCVSGKLLKPETLEGAEFYRLIGKPVPDAKEARPTPPVGELVARTQASQSRKEASDG
ncbi:MAG TPA: hypothetical protein VI136_18500 [Verrucomicrobiae bacterium]|jgi:hypothetical protein